LAVLVYDQNCRFCGHSAPYHPTVVCLVVIETGHEVVRDGRGAAMDDSLAELSCQPADWRNAPAAAMAGRAELAVRQTVRAAAVAGRGVVMGGRPLAFPGP
jgi:hypothetical protein